jgi:KUP system potassium uptake protein
MDTPNVPTVMLRAQALEPKLDPHGITYVLGRETVNATHRPEMAVWRERLFSFMARNAQRATTFFRIPSGQVVELGIQIDL